MASASPRVPCPGALTPRAIWLSGLLAGFTTYRAFAHQFPANRQILGIPVTIRILVDIRILQA